MNVNGTEVPSIKIGRYEIPSKLELDLRCNGFQHLENVHGCLFFTDGKERLMYDPHSNELYHIMGIDQHWRHDNPIKEVRDIYQT